MLKFEEKLKDNLVTYIFLSLLSNFVQFYFQAISCKQMIHLVLSRLCYHMFYVVKSIAFP